MAGVKSCAAAGVDASTVSHAAMQNECARSGEENPPHRGKTSLGVRVSDHRNADPRVRDRRPRARADALECSAPQSRAQCCSPAQLPSAIAALKRARVNQNWRSSRRRTRTLSGEQRLPTSAAAPPGRESALRPSVRFLEPGTRKLGDCARRCGSSARRATAARTVVRRPWVTPRRRKRNACRARHRYATSSRPADQRLDAGGECRRSKNLTMPNTLASR